MSEPTDTPTAEQPSPSDVLAAAAQSARGNGQDSIAVAFELLADQHGGSTDTPTDDTGQHTEQS